MAATKAGRIRAHVDGRCSCPRNYRRRCRGTPVYRQQPCTYLIDGELCIVKDYNRQLPLAFDYDRDK